MTEIMTRLYRTDSMVYQMIEAWCHSGTDGGSVGPTSR